MTLECLVLPASCPSLPFGPVFTYLKLSGSLKRIFVLLFFVFHSEISSGWQPHKPSRPFFLLQIKKKKKNLPMKRFIPSSWEENIHTELPMYGVKKDTLIVRCITSSNGVNFQDRRNSFFF